MKLLKNNKSAYSVLMALFMVGFLIVLSSGIFKLVLLEANDNKGFINYLKASSAAEGAGEYALLQIKENGYGYYDKVDLALSDKSILASQNPLDKSKYRGARDPLVSFDYNYRVSNYDGVLDSGGYDIIPLFYVDDSGENKSKDIELDITSGNMNKLSWNIVGNDKGVSGIGDFSSSTIGKGRDSNSLYFEESLSSFFNSSDGNYLILYNLDSSSDIEYSVNSLNTGEYITKPRTNITVSSQVAGYKQNFNIHLDNTKFLNILKYSIYSN